MTENPLLEIKDLKVYFRTNHGQLPAVKGINLSVGAGEIVGIVGESGCGKSVTSQSILRLLEYTDPVEYQGEILFRGQDLLRLPLKKLRNIRGDDISVIFQDPITSLNPVYTIENQLTEALKLRRKLSKSEAKAAALELLQLTGISNPLKRLKQYPHELSGGMQQRVMIAMALACEPELLIADEPTTALDITIQAQILELILKMKEEKGLSVLFITHNLGIVAEICDSVRVMYLGQIVEEASTKALFEEPLHPYTKGLIKSIPRLNGDKNTKLHVIEGTVPLLQDIKNGCHFATRCPHMIEKCAAEEPPLIKVDDIEHKVKCWRVKEL